MLVNVVPHNIKTLVHVLIATHLAKNVLEVPQVSVFHVLQVNHFIWDLASQVAPMVLTLSMVAQNAPTHALLALALDLPTVKVVSLPFCYIKVHVFPSVQMEPTQAMEIV